MPPPRRPLTAAAIANRSATSSSDTPTASAEEGVATPPVTQQANTDSNVVNETNELERQRKLEATEKAR